VRKWRLGCVITEQMGVQGRPPELPRPKFHTKYALGAAVPADVDKGRHQPVRHGPTVLSPEENSVFFRAA